MARLKTHNKRAKRKRLNPYFTNGYLYIGNDDGFTVKYKRYKVSQIDHPKLMDSMSQVFGQGGSYLDVESYHG